MATRKQTSNEEVEYTGGRDVKETEHKIQASRVKVQVKTYKQRKFIDVRRHYQGEDGKWFPTKKGVTISSVAGAQALAEAILKASKDL